MTTLFPIIAAARTADPARMRSLFQTSADYLALASFPLLAFTAAAAGPVVRLLFGDAFSDAAPALPVLMGAFVLICFGYLAGNMIIVLDLQRRFIRYAVAGLVVNVGLNLALVPSYGFLAAAWVTAATEAVVLVLALRAVLDEMDFRPGVGRIVRSAVAAAGMGALVFGLREAGVPLGVLVAAAAVAYPGFALAVRAFEPRELLALVRRQPA
jgi:O-antigen/teichoic acid export membrane protein